MLNRTILLRHFRVSKYKEDYNLCSTIRSEIVRHRYFREYEQKWRPPARMLSMNKIKSLKELGFQAMHLLEGRTLLSCVDVWVSGFGFDCKWCYDSCPNEKCKKAVVYPYTACTHCSFKVELPVKRFTLLVQLCDSTGSLTATAFD
jgi:hypothetical protein